MYVLIGKRAPTSDAKIKIEQIDYKRLQTETAFPVRILTVKLSNEYK